MYETKIMGFLQNGYSPFSSTDEQISVIKALRALRINTKVFDKFIVGDNVFQKKMFDTTALSGITLGTTSASATQVVESFAANTFVKTASSSNYTVDTTNKVLKATDGLTTGVIVSNSYTVSTTANNYVVIKVGTETPGTGSIKYEVSLDAGLTFKQVYANAGYFIGNLTDTGNLSFKVTLTGNAQISGGIGFQLR